MSNETFAVPDSGSITFLATIDADTPGTQPGRVVNGTSIAPDLSGVVTTMSSGRG